MDDAEQHIDRAPADRQQQRCQSGNHHQLAGAHARRHDRVGDSWALGKGARNHDADRDERSRAIAEGEDQAIEHQRMPGRRHYAHQADADRADDKPAGQHQSRAGVIGQIAGGKHRRRRHHLKQGDGETEFAAAPAEIVDDRLERQADGKARTAADEQSEKAGGEYERGPGGHRFSEQGNFTIVARHDRPGRAIVAILTMARRIVRGPSPAYCARLRKTTKCDSEKLITKLTRIDISFAATTGNI